MYTTVHSTRKGHAAPPPSPELTSVDGDSAGLPGSGGSTARLTEELTNLELQFNALEAERKARLARDLDDDLSTDGSDGEDTPRTGRQPAHGITRPRPAAISTQRHVVSDIAAVYGAIPPGTEKAQNRVYSKIRKEPFPEERDHGLYADVESPLSPPTARHDGELVTKQRLRFVSDQHTAHATQRIQSLLFIPKLQSPPAPEETRPAVAPKRSVAAVQHAVEAK